MAWKTLLLLVVAFMCLNAGLCRHYQRYHDDDDDDDYRRKDRYDMDDDDFDEEDYDDDSENNDEYNDGDDDREEPNKEEKEDDLGDLLDFDPTANPATQPPQPASTEAPATEKPSPEPPATEPPATEPPATAPPATKKPGNPLPIGIEKAIEALREYLRKAFAEKGTSKDKAMLVTVLKMVDRNQARIHMLESEVRRIETFMKESLKKKGGEGGEGGKGGGSSLSVWLTQIMKHLGGLKTMFGDAQARDIVRDALESKRRKHHSRHF